MHEFQLPDMTCGHCASMVGQALKLADANCTFQVDLSSRQITVQSAEDRAVLVETLTEAGYPPI